MILNNHMFKVDLIGFPKKCTSRFFIFYSLHPNKQSRLQVDEILDFFLSLLVNVALRSTYALSTSNAKINIISIF